MILDHTPTGIVAVDLDWRIVAVNRAICELLGYSAEELLGMTVDQISAPEDMPLNRLLAERLLRGEIAVAEMEKEYLRKDGQRVRGKLRSVVLRDREGRPVQRIGVVEDVTERRRIEAEQRALERKLLETQKMESLGLLAGGIAHDFNNLLVAVLGNVELALLQLEEHSPAYQTVLQLKTAAERAADLTRQLLAYSGRGRFELQPVELGALVEEMTGLLKASLPRMVTLELQREGEALAHGDPTQLRQVVLNLIVNAAEAIGEAPGQVSVRTGLGWPSPADCANLVGERPQGSGPYAFLEVRDTGIGMDEATRARIFDPFFTTKFTGRGLGLAAVLGIVRSHGGFLAVESAPARGATFRIWLPRAQRPAPVSAPETSERSLSPPRGIALVIDDEPSVREVAARMLEHLGFRVLTAADGESGLTLFAQHHQEIELVLLDLTMPGMDGTQACQRLLALQPRARVILMSGYSDLDADLRSGSDGAAGFLAKPFTLAQLRQLVARALDHP
ncbi:MAG: hypothetical protein KatS3mg061_3090 [Dehalococcoidia bacterium]|nr:MAG: hypothetical protein KatS3mg061_3090 [Dehalococcoidia bacterium]